MFQANQILRDVQTKENIKQSYPMLEIIGIPELASLEGRFWEWDVKAGNKRDGIISPGIFLSLGKIKLRIPEKKQMFNCFIHR